MTTDVARLRHSSTPRPPRTVGLVLLVVAPMVIAVSATTGYAVVQAQRDTFESRALAETRSIMVTVPDDISGSAAEEVGRALRRPDRREVLLVDATGAVSRSSGAVGLTDLPGALRSGTDLRPASGPATIAGTPYLVTGGSVGPGPAAVYLFHSELELRRDAHRTSLAFAGGTVVVLVALIAAGWLHSHRRLRSLADLRGRERAFTAHLGHELRTPVGALVTAASLVDEPGLRRSPEQVRRPVELMVTQSRRLRRIVEDLLELSRLETGQVEARFDVVDLPTVVEDTIADFGWTGVRLVVDGTGAAWTDHHSAARLLLNLVSNAVRHARQEVLVRVSDQQDEVVLEVLDDGPGLPAPVAAQLLGPAWPGAPDQDMARRTHGLGLLIARAHAALVEAQLEVDADLVAGTRIAVRFPAAAARGGRRRSLAG